MDILVTAVIGTERKKRRIAWVGLQPGGAVSVGLTDKTFVASDFKAQNFVWSAYNRETLHYVVPSDTSALKPIHNPHLTFHPPHDFHLTANRGRKLFEGIADLALMLHQDGVVPWVRFISAPVSELRDAGLPRNPERAEELLVRPPATDCSLGFGVDFAAAETSLPDSLLSRCVRWQNYWLHLHVIPMRGQVATLSWFHQR